MGFADFLNSLYYTLLAKTQEYEAKKDELAEKIVSGDLAEELKAKAEEELKQGKKTKLTAEQEKWLKKKYESIDNAIKPGIGKAEEYLQFRSEQNEWREYKEAEKEEERKRKEREEWEELKRQRQEQEQEQQRKECPEKRENFSGKVENFQSKKSENATPTNNNCTYAYKRPNNSDFVTTRYVYPASTQIHEQKNKYFELTKAYENTALKELKNLQTVYYTAGSCITDLLLFLNRNYDQVQKYFFGLDTCLRNKQFFRFCKDSFFMVGNSLPQFGFAEKSLNKFENGFIFSDKYLFYKQSGKGANNIPISEIYSVRAFNDQVIINDNIYITTKYSPFTSELLADVITFFVYHTLKKEKLIK